MIVYDYDLIEQATLEIAEGLSNLDMINYFLNVFIFLEKQEYLAILIMKKIVKLFLS